MRAGGSDDFADADGALRADRVAVEIDGLAVERRQRRRQLPGQRLGLARRQDRQEEIGAGKQRALVRRRLHARQPRPLGAGRTAPRQQGAHLRAIIVQPPADSGPHHALGDDRDDRHCRILQSDA